MIFNELRFGGKIVPGDFIGIGSDWGMTFGWYAGNGKAGNIQYVHTRSIIRASDDYTNHIEWSKEQNGIISNKYKRGLSFDHIAKTAVRSHKKDNVVKIVNPDELFSGIELETYKEAKDTLIKLNFLKP